MGASRANGRWTACSTYICPCGPVHEVETLDRLAHCAHTDQAGGWRGVAVRRPLGAEAARRVAHAAHACQSRPRPSATHMQQGALLHECSGWWGCICAGCRALSNHVHRYPISLDVRGAPCVHHWHRDDAEPRAYPPEDVGCTPQAMHVYSPSWGARPSSAAGMQHRTILGRVIADVAVALLHGCGGWSRSGTRAEDQRHYAMCLGRKWRSVLRCGQPDRSSDVVDLVSPMPGA